MIIIQCSLCSNTKTYNSNASPSQSNFAHYIVVELAAAVVQSSSALSAYSKRVLLRMLQITSITFSLKAQNSYAICCFSQSSLSLSHSPPHTLARLRSNYCERRVPVCAYLQWIEKEKNKQPLISIYFTCSSMIMSRISNLVVSVVDSVVEVGLSLSLSRCFFVHFV